MTWLVNKTVSPKEAAKILRKARKSKYQHSLSVFISAQVFLPTSDDKAYPMLASVPTTRKAALALLDDWQRFSDRKEQAGEPAARIEIKVAETCVFVG